MNITENTRNTLLERKLNDEIYKRLLSYFKSRFGYNEDGSLHFNAEDFQVIRNQESENIMGRVLIYDKVEDKKICLLRYSTDENGKLDIKEGSDE